MKKCNDKNCYTKNEAEGVRVSVMRKRNRKIRIYECDICYYYHLTSHNSDEFPYAPSKK